MVWQPHSPSPTPAPKPNAGAHPPAQLLLFKPMSACPVLYRTGIPRPPWCALFLWARKRRSSASCRTRSVCKVACTRQCIETVCPKPISAFYNVCTPLPPAQLLLLPLILHLFVHMWPDPCPARLPTSGHCTVTSNATSIHAQECHTAVVQQTRPSWHSWRGPQQASEQPAQQAAETAPRAAGT